MKIEPNLPSTPALILVDASLLLTIEVFLLTVLLFYLRWGNREQKRPTQFPEEGNHK